MLHYQTRNGSQDDLFYRLKQELTKDIPCRESKIKTLLKYFISQKLPPCIYIDGYSGTGKSLVVSSILEKLKIAHAIVNCVECYALKPFLEQILDKILNQLVKTPQESPFYIKCDDMTDFAHILQRAVKQNGKVSNVPIVIVLENCEEFNKFEPDINLLKSFLQLNRFIKLNLCVVFVSSIPYGNILLCQGLLPHQVSFPQYSREELFTILMLHCPTGYPIAKYHKHVEMTLNLCYQYCRTLPELISMVHFILEKMQRSTSESPSNKHLGIKSLSQDTMKGLFMRFHENTGEDRNCDKSGSMSHNQLSSSLTLPLYAKYILIAAYLAGNIPKKLDKQLFMKNCGGTKTKKTAKTSRKNAVACAQTCGSSLFSLERLLAIFCAILGEPVNLSFHLQSQIPHLVQLNMLAVTGSDSLNFSYRCLCGPDVILPIAKDVGFNIGKYLPSEV